MSIPFIDKLNQIDKDIENFNQSDFLTQTKLQLQPSGKVVKEIDGKIYKLYQLGEGYGRRLIGKMFAELNVPIFLQTDIVGIFPNFNAILLCEPKVEVIPVVNEEDLKKIFSKKGYDFSLVEKFGLNFYQRENCGYYKGEFKIFDGIWNLFPVIRTDLKVVRLQDSQGQILIEEGLYERNK